MRPILLSVLVTATLLAGCTGPAAPEPGDREATPDAEQDPAGGPDSTGRPTQLDDDLVMAAALSNFDACDDLEAHVKQVALELVTPWGLPGGGAMYPMEGDEAAEAATDDTGADGSGAAPTPGDAVGSNETGTNVQERGVDEPDHVKTDGSHLYLVTDGALRVLEVTGGDPVEVARVALREAFDAQLLLAGDRLLITSSAPRAVPFANETLRSPTASGDADIMPGPGFSGTTTLTSVDVSDPSDPRVRERLTVDGSTVSARLVDGVARVVVRMEQGNLPWVFPDASGLRAERRALEANRELIRGSDVEDWLPYAVHETADGDIREGTLLACEHVSRPATFAGLGMLSVLTFDAADGDLTLDPDRHVGVLAGGDTVYASRGHLYVATTRWIDWTRVEEESARRELADGMHTDIHAFDLEDATRARYLGSGRVGGTLLDQWAMSEHDGVLRVASTLGDPWGGRGRSESSVTMLDVAGGELRELGRVDGLGLTERIYAVRFIGDIGYVVTFRQTDPLYTIDVSDPAAPRVVGELKILGYSAYLHPVGDHLLLGLGQDADEQGRTKGTKLSLFDVGDPADPREIDALVLTDGASDAEHDHRAFMHDPATGLTVVPYTRWSYDEITRREDVDSGALAFEIRDRSLLERDRIRHVPSWLEDLREGLDATEPDDRDDADLRAQERLWEWGHRGRITRSIVLDGRLLTVSEIGVGIHDADTLQETGWLEFD